MSLGHSHCAVPSSVSLLIITGLLYLGLFSYSFADDATLTQDEFSLLLSKGVFIIESEHLNMCITVDSFGLSLQDCRLLSKNMLWKWVSRQRLFNMGSSSCLGLNISDLEEPLEMFECDSSQHTLWWKCSEDMLTGAAHYKVAAEGGKVVARKQLYHKWRRYLSRDENICEHSFQEVYTLQGNGLGMPCAFPFKYNSKWYHECIKEGREDGLYWCATTMLYDRDERWGVCPSPDTHCNVFWERNQATQACYQFNFASVLSWSEARASCQSQGGDLLSITSVEENNFVSEGLSSIGVLFWIGLNQLDEATGWHWSDDAPLALVNWRSNLTFHTLGEPHCGVYDSRGNHSWQSFVCEMGLPYACKRYITQRHDTIFDTWEYYPTQCESGWYPYNRYCYQLQKEEHSWKDASVACHLNGSELIRLTSLADEELVRYLLENENVTEAWIGMKAEGRNPVTFHWSDGSTVTFTNWHKHEPNIGQEDSELCVSTQITDGAWEVKKCTEKMFSICQKAEQSETESVDEGECQKGWERHAGYCYKIDKTHRTFQEASSGYYCASALATVTNRFEQAFIISVISNKTLAEDSYFWIGLHDQNSTGEYMWITNGTYKQPMSFTHWNKHQPNRNGGCVTMQNGNSFGRWQVRDCRTFKAMSLCKKPIASKEAELPPDPMDAYYAHCPSAWAWESEPHLRSCYKVFHHEKVITKRTWEEAEEFCQAFGAHLASFSHIDEEHFLTELLRTMFHQGEERLFWIGFNKRNPSSEGSWEWSDGNPVVSSFLEDMYTSDETINCAGYKADKKIGPLPCDAKLEWICKIPKGVAPNIPEFQVTDAPWIYFQGHEYFFYVSQSDWSSFEFVCGWLGSQIVTIHSPAEQAFIENRIKKYPKVKGNWWIGLVSENPHGYQRWKDNSPVLYTNWETGRDSTVDLKDPQCAYISSETGLWGYGDCSASHPAICKTTRIGKLEKSQTDHHTEDEDKHGDCPVGWLYFGYKCFLVHEREDGETMEDWFSAQRYCNQHSASLVYIENELEEAFLIMQLFGHKYGFWIGFQSDDYEKWITGSSVTYSNWSPNRIIQDPRNVTNTASEDQEVECSVISNNHNVYFTGIWYLDNCHKKGYGFICERPQGTSNGSSMYPVTDILEYGDKTYRIISENMTWYDAQRNCKKYGANLVSITDEYHQAFLTVIINRLGYSLWIGLTRLNDGHHFEWIDGNKCLFSKFEVDGSWPIGNCAYMDIFGYWEVRECDTQLQGAACLISNETKVQENVGGCSETWIQFKNYCYSISTVLNNTDFHAAQEVCDQQGSSLLTILDDEEHTFILEELGPFSSVQKIWLNRIVFSNNGTAVWLDGSLVNYSNLVTNKPPNEALKGDYCVTLRTSDGSWLLTQCNEKRGFVCKRYRDYRKDESHAIVKKTDHAIIPIAVIASLMLFIVLTFLWYLIRQNKLPSCTRTNFHKLHCAQSSTNTADVEESILITEMDTGSEK